MMSKIKIGHQEQANKPIFLLSTGAIVCGNFSYNGRFKKKFKQYYDRIYDLSKIKKGEKEIDVSGCRYWNAIGIYHNYVVEQWVSTVSARRLEKFANETEISIMVNDIIHEFKRALVLRWRKIFKNSDPNDPNTPRKAWQII